MPAYVQGQTGEWCFPGTNGLSDRYVRVWAPAHCRAAVQIVHGMSEHSARYAAFADFLKNHEIAVYMMDLAGHGLSSKPEDYGYMGDSDGWMNMIEDIHCLTGHITAEHGETPYFLLGHSMGSFLSRGYAAQYGSALDGLILSGTAGPNKALSIGLGLCEQLIKRKGLKHRSKMLQKLSTGSNNRRYGPSNGSEWLSRDPEVVRAYDQDSMCGFPFTAAGYRDLFTGLGQVTDAKWAEALPKDLPILLFAGDADPVGNYGKGVLHTEKALKAAGVSRTETVLYPNGRHEMLNETNRDEVMEMVVQWLEQHIQIPAS